MKSKMKYSNLNYQAMKFFFYMSCAKFNFIIFAAKRVLLGIRVDLLRKVVVLVADFNFIALVLISDAVYGSITIFRNNSVGLIHDVFLTLVAFRTTADFVFIE